MTTNISTKRKQQRRLAIVRLSILAAILVCINMLAARFHYSIDLTQEKRFTLTQGTRKLLREMDDLAVIEVYLKGKFPAGFQRLAESTRERLQYFKSYAGNKLTFRFVDPVEGKSDKEKRDIYMQMAAQNIQPVNLQVEEGDEGYSEKIILPYAIVKYKGKEKAVKLLENNPGIMRPLDALNYSESLLEYKLASALNELSHADKPRIAYITGNNEAIGYNTFDALTTLAQSYHLDTFDLARNYHIPLAYDAIIINKPNIPFEEKQKFLLDQYIMGGGRVLWIINELHTPMDSLVNNEQFITSDYELNLDDMLFKYGVRINPDLIEDLQCVQIPMVRMNGDQREMVGRKWIYFPVVNPVSKHAIVKNMPPVLSKFANSMDTIENPEIHKTVLLQSSKYSRTVGNPARVSLGIMQYPMREEMFNRPYRPMAVLLEGKFQSVFQNQLAPSFLRIWKDSLKQTYRPECDTANSMIVISADVMNNDFYASKGPMEMGYWDYTKSLFANKSLLMNCMEYLTDRSGLIEARSKDVTLRLLDAGRVKQERAQWQWINIGIPIVVVLVFASCYMFFRKRRYEIRK